MTLEIQNTPAGTFHFATRIASLTTVTETRAFVGLATRGASLQGAMSSSGEPSRLTNLIGMGYDPDEDDEAYWHVLHSDWGGPVKRAPIRIAPCNTTDDYDLVVTANANEKMISVLVTNRTNGETSKLEILSQLPPIDELVFVRAQISSAFVEEAVALGLARISTGARA
jgi:hypothetical protein